MRTPEISTFPDHAIELRTGCPRTRREPEQKGRVPYGPWDRSLCTEKIVADRFIAATIGS
jgi:hypothetical protein